MRVVNENFETIAEYDLNLGYLVETTGIKESATPIDNKTKFAWYDEDYETVLMYVPNEDFGASEPSPQDDMDAMMVDHEFRLTMLELGL